MNGISKKLCMGMLAINSIVAMSKGFERWAILGVIGIFALHCWLQSIVDKKGADNGKRDV